MDRDLHDCRAQDLSSDWRFNIAYNAALQAATVALHVSGYRAPREQHHYRTIQSLSLTIGVSADLVRRFDLFRKKRHQAAYRSADIVSIMEAEEMRDLAGDLRGRLVTWLGGRDRRGDGG